MPRNKFQATHGESRTTLYKKWNSMLNRCTNPKDPRYKHYGAKGIGVDPSWRGEGGYVSFRNHLLEIHPDLYDLLSRKYELDRVNTNKSYEPGNVRLVTKKDNIRNRNITPMVLDLDGITTIPFKLFWEKYALPEVKYHVAYLRYFVRGSISTPLKACRTSKNANCPEEWLILWEDYWISTAEYARRIGVSKGSVVRAKEAGMSVEDFVKREKHFSGKYQFRGKLYHLKDLAPVLGLTKGQLNYKLHEKGMSLQEILTSLGIVE